MSSYSVDQYLAEIRVSMKSKGMPDTLEDIRIGLERLLANPRLLKDYVDLDKHTGFTRIGYDPETDIHVIVHGGGRGSRSSPHDHGPCAVVYGNYTNYTHMKCWQCTDNSSTADAAQLEMIKDYTIHAGEATAFDVGDIHSIEYPDNTYFIRVTVGEVKKEQTRRFTR